jgi:hypothetical protein
MARYAFATAIASLATSGTAFAQTPPPSVVGIWHGFANQTEIKLAIRSQGAVGVCPQIIGAMSNVSPAGGASTVQGFYCPDTGRISFIRKDPNTNDTFQSYVASLSELGPVQRMAGTFSELNFVGHMREFNFAVDRKAPQ